MLKEKVYTKMGREINSGNNNNKKGIFLNATQKQQKKIYKVRKPILKLILIKMSI
jgi:hypothetical protein